MTTKRELNVGTTPDFCSLITDVIAPVTTGNSGHNMILGWRISAVSAFARRARVHGIRCLARSNHARFQTRRPPYFSYD